MTRYEFLSALERCLSSLPEEERKDALRYYEDYLDAAGPENEAAAIAELGTPEEVARKILDEQAPGAAAAPAQAAAKKPHAWRMWLGGGIALLALGCFFFQQSNAAPVKQPETSASASISGASANSSSVNLHANAFGNSTYQIPLEKLNGELNLKLDYGSVAFVIDPSATFATLQFDSFPYASLTRTSGAGGRTTFRYELPESYQITEDSPEALLTITLPAADSLERLVLDLKQGDANLGTLQLKRLTAELSCGSLYADDLTAEEIQAAISWGQCDIRALSGVQEASIDADYAILLDLTDDPSAYTIHARSENVVRIIEEDHPERFDSEQSDRTLNLSAHGMIALNAPRHP